MSKNPDLIPKLKFIEELAAVLGITTIEAERFLNACHRLIYTLLQDGKKVQLSGFGTFSVKRHKPRLGFNPRTRLRMELEAFNKPKFKAGEAFKQAVKLK